MKIEDYFYWPLFPALFDSPEAHGFLVGAAFVALVVSTCTFLCAVFVLLMPRAGGARR